MANIPERDADFDAYVQTAIQYINDNMATWDFDVGDLAQLNGSKADWDGKFPLVEAAKIELKSIIQNKDDSRKAKPNGLQVVLRAILAIIAAHPNTTNIDRVHLRIPIPGEPSEGGGASPPDGRPVVTINTSKRLEHKLRWTDELTGKRAKPAGVKETQIWMAITAEGAPVPGVEAFLLVGTRSKSEFLKTFDSADAGKVANYILRWVHRDGTPGSWSEVGRATIVG